MKKDNFSVSDSLADIMDKLDGWMDAIILKLPNFAVAIIVMVVFYFLGRFLKRLSYRFLFRKFHHESVKQILARTVYGIILLIGFFIALGVLQLDKVLTSVLAGAGVVGLAIGLALQGTLSNTFSGLILSFLPKVRIGDFVQTDENKGFVEEINLWNVTIRRPDNEYVIIPNKNFIERSFINYSWTDRTRLEVECRVDYSQDLEQLEQLVIKIISENFEQKDDEEVEFFFTKFDEYAINFMTRFWITSTKPRPKLEAQHKAIKLIKRGFDEAGIKIPFPIRSVDFNSRNLRESNKNQKKD